MSAPTAVSTTPASAELMSAPELAASAATTQVDIEKTPSNDEKVQPAGSDINREISTDEKITDVESGAPAVPAQDESRLLKGRKLALVFTGMLLGAHAFSLSAHHHSLLTPVSSQLSFLWAACPGFQCRTKLTSQGRAQIALDQTILSPALPVIASKFNALEQIAWIASAYFLTQRFGAFFCG